MMLLRYLLKTKKRGKFPFALMDSKYKAQMDDIIKISVNNIYQSRES
jgi:dGTPase